MTSLSPIKIVNVMAFVDWNSQLLLASSSAEWDFDSVAQRAFKHTTRRIARCLSKMNSDWRFKVSLRLYHGWHKGYEPTPNRRAVQVVIGRTDFSALSQRQNVVFSESVGFGDRLISAMDGRLHDRLGIHLPNTLRTRYKKVLEEKMVDTALAADVVSTAYSNGDGWVVVVTEDDDAIPAVLTAEAIVGARGGKVLLLMGRAAGPMVNLDQIIFRG